MAHGELVLNCDAKPGFTTDLGPNIPSDKFLLEGGCLAFLRWFLWFFSPSLGRGVPSPSQPGSKDQALRSKVPCSGTMEIPRGKNTGMQQMRPDINKKRWGNKKAEGKNPPDSLCTRH